MSYRLSKYLKQLGLLILTLRSHDKIMALCSACNLTVTGILDFVHRPEFQITREHWVSETGPVSFFRRAEWETYSVGAIMKRKVERLMLALSKRPNRVGYSFPSPEDGNGPGFRYTCFLVFRIFGRWTKSTNPVILNIIHHRLLVCRLLAYFLYNKM
jgi:hypothetical protein